MARDDGSAGPQRTPDPRDQPAPKPPTGPGSGDPLTDYTTNEYWANQGKSPPWIGFPDYQSWAKDQQTQKDQAVALQSAQLARDQQLLGQGGANIGVARDRLTWEQQKADLKRQQDQAAQAEETRQWNETFGFDKAKFDEQQRFAQGKELLGLGSRPATLIRYLYALRGLQAPQGLDQQPTALPGFPGAAPGTVPGFPGVPSGGGGGGGAPGGAAATGAGPAVPVPVPVPVPVGGQFTTGSGTPAPVQRAGGAQTPGLFGSPANPNPLPGPTYAGPPITSLAAGSTTPTIPSIFRQAGTQTPSGIIGQGAPGQQFQGVMGTPIAFNANAGAPIIGAPGGLDQPSQQIPNLGSGTRNTPTGYSATPDVIASYLKGLGVKMAKGGVIPELVIGRGVMTGRPYMFGEKGPERVVPGLGKKPKGDGTYALGGTIGATVPSFSRGAAGPSGAVGPPSLFNPPSLPGIVNGPTLPGGVPNLPQNSYFSGGGQSLIPSQQKLTQSLPTEREAYSGFLQDVAGVDPNDVLQLSASAMPSRYSPYSGLGRVITGLSSSKYSTST